MNIQQNTVSENNFEQCIKCTVCTVYCPVAAVNPAFPDPSRPDPTESVCGSSNPIISMPP